MLRELVGGRKNVQMCVYVCVCMCVRKEAGDGWSGTDGLTGGRGRADRRTARPSLTAGRTDVRTDGQADGRTDGRMGINRQKDRMRSGVGVDLSNGTC